MKKETGNLKSFVIVIVAVIVVSLLIFMSRKNPITPVTSMGNTTVTDPSTLPGIQTGETPWIAETDHLKDRLTAIGLPALSEEGTVLHTHQHLDIYIDGTLTPVTPGIGINEEEQFISPIHVHDDTNVIHVESPTIQKFTLGQFFDIWGVKLTADCLGGYCADGTKSLAVFVNGTPYSGNPRDLELTPHEEIVLAYGTSAELPQTIPSSYDFPLGE